MTITRGKLCGVITKILSDGKISNCKPVFTDASDFANHSYYCGIANTDGQIYEFKKIDIHQYGSKTFLPAARKKNR